MLSHALSLPLLVMLDRQRVTLSVLFYNYSVGNNGVLDIKISSDDTCRAYRTCVVNPTDIKLHYTDTHRPGKINYLYTQAVQLFTWGRLLDVDR